MEKILIFYGSYGGGHLSAANSIREYLQNNYPNISINMIDFMEYINKPLNKITTKAYSDMAKSAKWMWGKVYSNSEYGALSKINSSAQKIMSVKLHCLIDDFDPDLIISTHPFSSHMCALLKKKKKISCKIATILTDYAPHSQWLMYPAFIDYFFVAHEGMKKDLLNRNIKENQIKVTGIPLSNKFLNNYNKPIILSEFNLSETKKTILFFAGGEQGFGRDKIINIFKILIKDFPEFQVVAIAGKNIKIKNLFDEIVEETNSRDFIKVLEYTNRIPELMSFSDLVITKPGGLTSTESLASGLPIIIIDPIPGQEEENAKFLEENGAGIWIKKHDNVEEKLSNILNSPQLLHSMKVQSKLLAKRNSTKDICEILLGN